MMEISGVADAGLKELVARFWDWRMTDSPEFAHVCGVHIPNVLDNRSLDSFDERGTECE